MSANQISASTLVLTAEPALAQSAVVGTCQSDKKRKLRDRGLRPLAIVSLMMTFGYAIAQAQGYTPRETQEGQSVLTDAGKPAYNIIFVISDQRSYRLFAGKDYSLPAIDAIARHGVTFRNHYIASAMCSPSRAAFLSGQPPQVNGVFDQMQYDFVPTLSPDLPNVGSVLKGLGYKTAYFGKFEMDKKILNPEPTVNYSTACGHTAGHSAAAGKLDLPKEVGVHPSGKPPRIAHCSRHAWRPFGIQQGLERLVWHHPHEPQGYVEHFLQLLPEHDQRRRPCSPGDRGCAGQYGFVAGHCRYLHRRSRRDGRRPRRAQG
jgi:hypothetical protein